MNSIHRNTPCKRWSPKITPLFTIYVSGMVGGSLGLFLGAQGDVIFDFDTRIIGVVLGAVLGSLLPRSHALGTLAQSSAAGVGVGLPLLVWVGHSRVASEVLIGMTTVAVACSALTSWMQGEYKRAGKYEV